MKLKVGFFSIKKKFFADFPKYGKFFLSKLHFCKFSSKFENTFFAEKSACYQWGIWSFFSKYPRFSNLKVDFFPLKKSFSQIFQNKAKFFHLNFFSKNKNQKNVAQYLTQYVTQPSQWKTSLLFCGARTPFRSIRDFRT